MDNQIKLKVETFFKKYATQTYQNGDIIIQAAENPSTVYFLEKGSVKQYVITADEDQITTDIFKAGSFFPVMFAITDMPNKYFFQAEGTTTIWIAPKEAVQEFLQKEPDVTYDLLRHVYTSSEGILTRMVYLMTGNAYKRCVLELIITAKHFGKTSINTDGYIIDTAKIDLAMQAGMSRETMSRTISLLKEKGLIMYTKEKLVIKDLSLLEKELH
jgi:CRP/FNR family cyclic AMP-dependent transcriptional regulator